MCFPCRQEYCSAVLFKLLTFRFIQLFSIPLQREWPLSRTVTQTPTCNLILIRPVTWLASQFVKFKMVFIYQDEYLWPMIMRFTPSVRSLSDVASESCKFGWETMALSCPKVVRQAFPLSTLLSSSRLSMAWCPSLCARRLCLKPFNTSDLPRREPLAMVAFIVSLSAWSFPLTPACWLWVLAIRLPSNTKCRYYRHGWVLILCCI